MPVWTGSAYECLRAADAYGEQVVAVGAEHEHER
jgi:hypothetical protein